MEIDYNKIQTIIKGAFLESLFEYDQYRKKRVRRQDPDLISTAEAYRLRGRTRVTQLILKGLLKQTSSGVNANSVKYVSKKKLLDLDKVTL